MDQNNLIECGGFYFIYNFDSGNLGHVERVPTELIAPAVLNAKTNQSETPDFEFNLWTRPDCAGTKFENGNRTWFYFGIQANVPNTLVRLNLINLNKQSKMYAQGMAPVTRTLPGKPQWERIRDRPIHNTDDNTFTLSFKYRTSENTKATTFFAFTYPFSFAELQIALNSIDMKMLPCPPPQSPDDIYYCRECVIYSLEGRRVDLLTISSHHGITSEREERLKNLFPEKLERPFKFLNKKVIFISARVHPGETPSSFVFNGFLNLLLNRHDPIAIQLRKLYVFKMIPFLNPDGVARGHYRTDTRGVNLNRVYLNPSLILHPTVYASRALIRFYHFGCEKNDNIEECNSFTSHSLHNISESAETIPSLQAHSSTAGKSRMANKSSTTLKRPSAESRRDSIKSGLSGEASKLAGQVYDMSLREQPSQTSASSSSERPSAAHLPGSSSLLNEQALRSCLGSNVHLSTSEELKFQGNNPLLPLRQTLKTSISLLMDSNTAANEPGLSESRLGNVKMGWCRDCRASISKLEDTMPGLANLVPGYATRESPDVTFNSIDEYREHQKKQLEEQAEWFKEFEKMAQEPREDGVVYFCTNCFKRYILSENNEEIICDTVSVTSVAVPAGDNESIRGEATSNKPAASTGDTLPPATPHPPGKAASKTDRGRIKVATKKKTSGGAPQPPPPTPPREPDSGLFMYLDLHGHASKKGIFMYGNHFTDVDSCVECMLLPRIMSLNNLHFHFSSCNFTERNMYLKDRRDGMSREGSGRVAMYKTTGLVRCYTLECNYNTGRLVNVLPPSVRDPPPIADVKTTPIPPKYTPHIFEEVGRSLGASILDLTGQHPNSRLPGSEHRNLSCLREWLRAHTRSSHLQLNVPRLRPKTASQSRLPLYVRPKGKATEERKENVFREPERRTTSAGGGGGGGGGAGAGPGAAPAPPAPLAPRTPADIVNLNVRIPRHHLHTHALPSGSRPRFMQDDTKGKTVGVKRRNALSIRKPTSKTGVSRARRAGPGTGGDREPRDDATGRLGKHRARAAPRCRAMASSSSEDMLVPSATWEDVGSTALAPDLGAARRRAFPPAPAPAHAHLKKIRLKAGL